MKTVKVKCTLMVDVEVPDDWDWAQTRFEIEDNSCPASHAVGSVIKKAIMHGEENSVCWACNLQGDNKLIGVPGHASNCLGGHGVEISCSEWLRTHE